MDIHAAALASLVLGAALANVPFAPARLSAPRRLAALALLYGVWVGLTLALQARVALAHPMAWQVWAASIAFFGVLAFPGVTWRYLWRR